MSETLEAFVTLMTVIWAINILLELGFVAAAFYRFRASPAGLLLAGSYALMVAMSVVTRVLRWIVPGLADPGSTAGMVMFTASSLLSILLLAALGVGVLLIPSSIDKLAGQKA